VKPGAYLSFISYVNFPNNYIRHYDYKVYTETYDPDDQDDPTWEDDTNFVIESGLGGMGSVSFRALSKPNYYLRHSNFVLYLVEKPSANDGLYNADTSFFPRGGLSSSKDVSFESLNYPGYYLRHNDVGGMFLN